MSRIVTFILQICRHNADSIGAVKTGIPIIGRLFKADATHARCPMTNSERQTNSISQPFSAGLNCNGAVAVRNFIYARVVFPTIKLRINSGVTDRNICTQHIAKPRAKKQIRLLARSQFGLCSETTGWFALETGPELISVSIMSYKRGSRLRDPMRSIFSIYLILPAVLGPGVHSASNRN
jgi:hypothetical protein